MNPVAFCLIGYAVVCVVVAGTYVAIAWRTGKDPS